MAVVAFTLHELVHLLRHGERSSLSPDENVSMRADASALIALMRDVRRSNHREIDAAMSAADEFLEGNGVEMLFVRDGQIVNDAWDATFGIEYVNLGDTYRATVIYSYERHEFYIGSWGGWVEATEAQFQREVAPECAECGNGFNPEEAGSETTERGDEYDLCGGCVRDRDHLPTWTPQKFQPLIAMLRSIEGPPIAVHVLEHTDNDVILAFSALETEDHFIAQRDDEPFVRHWSGLVGAFRRGQNDLYICGSGGLRGDRNHRNSFHHVQPDLGIERESFQRLAVAVSEYLDSERVDPGLLNTPPVLWTCDQVNEVQWIDDERGNGGGVQAFVRRHPVGSTIEADDLVVWAAAGDELRELINDGFIRWNRDDTVREYLQSIGVCRA